MKVQCGDDEVDERRVDRRDQRHDPDARILAQRIDPFAFYGVLFGDQQQVSLRTARKGCRGSRSDRAAAAARSRSPAARSMAKKRSGTPMPGGGGHRQRAMPRWRRSSSASGIVCARSASRWISSARRVRIAKRGTPSTGACVCADAARSHRPHRGVRPARATVRPAAPSRCPDRARPAARSRRRAPAADAAGHRRRRSRRIADVGCQQRLRGLRRGSPRLRPAPRWHAQSAAVRRRLLRRCRSRADQARCAGRCRRSRATRHRGVQPACRSARTSSIVSGVLPVPPT